MSHLEALFKVKISDKGQIVIPKRLREAFHLSEGETILLIPRKEGILIKHAPRKASGLRGLLKGLNVDVGECEAILEEAKGRLIKLTK